LIVEEKTKEAVSRMPCAKQRRREP